VGHESGSWDMRMGRGTREWEVDMRGEVVHERGK